MTSNISTGVEWHKKCILQERIKDNCYWYECINFMLSGINLKMSKVVFILKYIHTCATCTLVHRHVYAHTYICVYMCLCVFQFKNSFLHAWSVNDYQLFFSWNKSLDILICRILVEAGMLRQQASHSASSSVIVQWTFVKVFRNT